MTEAEVQEVLTEILAALKRMALYELSLHDALRSLVDAIAEGSPEVHLIYKKKLQGIRAGSMPPMLEQQLNHIRELIETVDRLREEYVNPRLPGL